MASLPSQAALSSSATGMFKAPSMYPPCVHSANELDPIAISQMKPETHHRGKRTVIRIVIPAERNGAAVVSVFMDEEGTMGLLQLHNQLSDTFVPAEQALRQYACYLIKDPFLQVAAIGGFSLRVDHPSDIMLLSHDHELLPAEWKTSERAIGKSHGMRMKGNDAVGKKRWAMANNLYTTAIDIAETAEESKLAYLNRSLANLRLGRPAAALADAIKSYEGDDSARSEKGLFREASALYELARYDQCLNRLQALRAAYPASSSAIPMIDRVQARLQEQQSGQYDFRRMYEQAKATPPLIDCATYAMPVEIRDSPGKGRGVFTTRKVLAGELLICEKAFGYIYAGKDDPGSRGMTELDTCTDLQAQILQKMFHNLEDARMVGSLYHGDYDAVSAYEIDGKPVVDSFLVGKVMTLTNYRASRTSLSDYAAYMSADLNAGEIKPITIGVWSFISHINHSCISNSCRSFIGDMQIVRATKDLEAGTEVYAWYYDPMQFESIDQAQKHMSKWDFTCDCAFCIDRQMTTKKEHLKRESLLKDLNRFLDNGAKKDNILGAQKTLERLTETYSAAAKEPGAVRLELWGPCFILAKMLRIMEKPSEAIETVLKGLEALGFVISANPTRVVAKSSKPELRIRQWGLVDTLCVDAFHILHEAYRKIAPENSKAARDYMEVAYSMLVGEKDTFLDTYAGLATG